MPDPRPLTLELLPAEVIIQIAENLATFRDLNRLSWSSRRMYSIVNEVLLKRDLNTNHGWAALWAAKRGYLGTIRRAGWAGHFNPRQSLERNRVDAVCAAILTRNHHVLQVLLDEFHVSVDGRWGPGDTALVSAAEADNLEAVQMLVRRGANVNSYARGGFPPLTIAACKNSLRVMWLLIKHGAHINSPVEYYARAICGAVNYNREQACRLLLYYGAELSRDEDESDIYTPPVLHYAVHHGNFAIVQLLVEHNAPLDAVDGRSHTVLGLAVHGGKTAIAHMLIRAGANVNVLFIGVPLVMFAINRGDIFLLQLLLRYGASPSIARHAFNYWSPLSATAHKGELEMGRLLLKFGASADGNPGDHYTPLHEAARNGDLAFVHMLITHGASLETTTQQGETALMIAAKEGKDAVVRMLLKLRANSAAIDANGHQFTHLAASFGHSAVLDLLPKAARVDINVQDDDGRSPFFHAAMRSGSAYILRHLVELGADINAADGYGTLPLAMAVRNGHIDAVRFILDQDDVVVDSTDCMGRTAFWGANRCGNKEMVQLLRDYVYKYDWTIDEGDLLSQGRDVVHFHAGTCYCDICGRCRVHRHVAKACSICHPPLFLVCEECLELGQWCRNQSHELHDYRCITERVRGTPLGEDIPGWDEDVEELNQGMQNLPLNLLGPILESNVEMETD